jgi:Domain of unknown function (DUF5655)/Domain of unknown function (DUF4287)
MATVDEALQTQIRNIEATYGKPMPEWFAIIAASGKTKHPDVVGMLKTTYGMTHGSAHRVSLLARQAATPPTGDQGADPADALYLGPKTHLRPIHDAVMQVVLTFGGDIECAPKKGYVSLRRHKQFAMIQPSTSGRVDIGLILKDLPPDGRLEPATGFNALFTHRVRLTSPDEVDPQLIGWLQHAYNQSG